MEGSWIAAIVLLVLGGGGVQQDVHGQLAQLALLPLEKDPLVPEAGARHASRAGDGQPGRGCR